jgi:hypothetical protein
MVKSLLDLVEKSIATSPHANRISAGGTDIRCLIMDEAANRPNHGHGITHSRQIKGANTRKLNGPVSAAW